MDTQRSTPTTARDRFHVLMKEAKECSHCLQLALTLSRQEIPNSDMLMDALLTIENEIAAFTVVSRNHPAPWELLCMVLREIVSRLRAVDGMIAEHLDSMGEQ